MRISDWSSDVCSSDLQPGPDQRLFRLRQGNDEVGVAYDMFGRFRHRERRPPRGLMPIDKLPRLFGTTRQDADVIDLKSLEQGRDDLVGDTARRSESVVKGKSVSVRVDLGGRRIIKKKTTNTP